MALVGVSEGAAMIIYIGAVFLTVVACYSLVFVGKAIKAWDKAVMISCGISLLAGYALCDKQISIYEYYDNLQYGQSNSVGVCGTVMSIQKKSYNYVVALDTEDGIVYLQLEDIRDIRYGARVAATGSINPMKQADNPGNYDERSYLHGNGVILKIKVADEDLKKVGKTDDYTFINEALYHIKQKAIDILSRQCTDKEMGILAAIALGEKAYLAEEIKELYSSQGIAHVMAISGLHISVIGMGLYSLMRRRMRYISSAAISAVIMILFLAMVGNPISAVRAVIMFVIHVLADVLGRKYDMLSAISISALMLLIDNPFYITNSSFILSYSAMVAVSVTAPVILDYFAMKNSLFKMVLFNLSLTFTSMPINSCLFYRLPTYSIFMNLMVVPLMGIMLAMAIIGMLFSVFAEGLGAACLGTSVYILRFYEWLCRVAENLPASSVVTGNVSMGQMVIYYCALTVLLLAMWRQCIRRDSGKEKTYEGQDKNDKKNKYDNQNKYKSIELKTKKSSVKLSKRYINNGVIIFLAFLMIYIVYQPKNNGFEIYFLDVGQGDGAYIHSETGNDYLIDCGSVDEKNVGKYKLESFLEYKDVDRVECVFISHCDTDHISGILGLIELGNIAVETIALPATERENPSQNGTKLVRMANEKDIEIKYFAKGSSYRDGDLELVCISPDVNDEYGDINEASMVLMMRYENVQVLYAGDIGLETEAGILKSVEAFMNDTMKGTDKEAMTIYKVAHHGSKHSNSEELLELLQPDIAIISCGESNSYGHPHTETLERLKKVECKVFMTKDVGAITVKYEKGVEAIAKKK